MAMTQERSPLFVRWGNQVRKLRKEQELTVAALARRADVDLGTISRVERGLVNASEQTREQIAKALGVTTGDIWNYPTEAEVAS